MNTNTNTNTNNLPLLDNINQIQKKKYKSIHINPFDLFNVDSFISKLDVLDISNRYSILLRVCFGNNYGYKMLGDQVNFEFGDLLDKKEYILEIQTILISRLRISMQDYKYNGDDISDIQLLIYKLYYTDKIVKGNNSRFSLKNIGVSNKLIETNINNLDLAYNNVLPLTMDLGIYKNKLEFKSENGFLTVILIKDKWVDFYSLIHKRNPNNKYIINNRLNDNLKLFMGDKGKLVIIIEILNLNNSLTHDINIYTTLGTHVLNVKDKYINNNTFTRTIGNVTNTITFNKENILPKTITSNKEENLSSTPFIKKTSILIALNPVKYKQNKFLNNLNVNSPFIGTLDLETYNDNGISKVYALGFYTKQSYKKLNTFYIDPNTLDSNELILRCIDAMLVSKYSGYTFYVHNLGRYDIAFLLRPLIRENINSFKYKLETISRDNLILSLVISKKVGSKTNTIKIVDSYNILSHSLKDLCEIYQAETSKDFFPYKFMSKDTLFYVGNKPSKSKYENIDKKNYDLITKKWNSQDETIKYLEKDLLSLFEIINKFSDYTYVKYGVQVANNLTISSLAMSIYLNKYYKNNIPLITKTSLFEDIKLSYFGGITEVYKPTNTENETLYYYDVNSLYPYASINKMPGLNCTFESLINFPINQSNYQETEKLFGFYYCKIKTSDLYIGLLPVRTKGGIIMPNGQWEGWYFSEEIKFAASKGYEILITKGYTFDKVDNVFDKYVSNFYNIKSNTSNVVEKAVSKSFLNNLIGRFGLSINKPKTELVNDTKYNELLQTKSLSGIAIPIEDCYLVSYNNKTSKKICDSSNVDYKNTLHNNLKNNEESEHSFLDVSIAIASAVNSYARIFITKTKLDIINKGGNIYYSDTDSIVTNIPLNPELVGNKIGQFKLEHKLKKAYFITSKTYILINTRNKRIIKSAGVTKPKNHSRSKYNLNLNKFIALYKGLEVETKRNESTIDFSGGYVNLNTNKITLYGDSFTKRSKVYNSHNMWIDTKPLTIDVYNKTQ